MRKSALFTQRNFWAVVPLSLSEVATCLGQNFGMTDTEYGSEAPEEWLEGFAHGDVSFYLYRQGGLTAPIRFIVTPGVRDPVEFGRRLARSIGQPVSYGDVTYLGDEKYEFEELSKYDLDA